MKFTKYIKKLPVKGLGWPLRLLSDVTDITVHHSAEPGNIGPDNFARYHTLSKYKGGKGYPAIAYHLVIMPDGEIRQCLKLAAYSSHNGFNNKKAVGVCLCGNFEETVPTDAQLVALDDAIELLKAQIPTIKYLNGHCEYPKPAGRTLCPGKNLSIVPLREKHGLISNPKADIIH
jgi:N-acetylmuramoyl-L-alanine amidase